VRVVLAVVLTACWAGSAFAGEHNELTPFLSVQHFEWKEYYGGRRLLKESGPLYSGGVLFEHLFASSAALRAKSELFGGVVAYRGETQGANPLPVSTDVGYFGTAGEVDGGYRLQAGSLDVTPFAGLGFRWWVRDLQDSTTAGGLPVTGYTETWRTLHLRLGARGQVDTDSGLSFFAEGGSKYPLYTGNTVDFAGFGETTFHPGARWSGFAETGLSYRHFKASFTYEGFSVSQSPLKSVGARQFFQPESTSLRLGVSVGWIFN
jgi:hypothetical protein